MRTNLITQGDVPTITRITDQNNGLGCYFTLAIRASYFDFTEHLSIEPFAGDLVRSCLLTKTLL